MSDLKNQLVEQIEVARHTLGEAWYRFGRQTAKVVKKGEAALAEVVENAHDAAVKVTDALGHA